MPKTQTQIKKKIFNPEYTITKRDWFIALWWVLLYILIAGIGAFLFVPKYWFIEASILIIGLYLLVNWHKNNFRVMCMKCNSISRLTFISDLLSPHGIKRNEDENLFAWHYWYCPVCKKWSRLRLIK